MNDEEQNTNAKNRGTWFIIFCTLSALSFIGSIISIWQGIVQLRNFAGEFEDFKSLFHSLLTFQNSGLILVGAGIFLILVSIQFSIYALISKK